MRRILGWLGRLLLLVVAAIAVLLGILIATRPRPGTSPDWTRMPGLPLARGEVAAAVLGPGSVTPDRLLVAGGLRGLTTTSDAVHILDPSRLEWDTAPALPEARHHAAAATLGPHVYVTGGASSVTDWTPRREVWRLEVGGGWSTIARMPEGRQGHAMVESRRRLFVIGGVGQTGRVLIFAPDGGWSFGRPLPQPRDHLRAAVFAGEIWALGGRDGRPTARVDVYDPLVNRWRRGPDLPEPMSAMAVGVLDDGLHVVGGEDPRPVGGGVAARHVVLDDPSGDWRDASPALLHVHGAGFGVLDDRLLVAGGATRQGAFSVLAWTDVTQAFRAG